jgi:sugar/nucleoside kinase (ribokinase family)
MYDIICFGSVVIDLYFKAASFKTKDNNFLLSIHTRKDVDEFFQGVGGGAVNVAIGAQNLGASVGLACVIGKNSFELPVRQFLESKGIDYSMSEFVKDYSNISLVITTLGGERSIINYRSPLTTKYTKPENEHLLAEGKMLYMANLANMNLQDRTDILKLARKSGVKTVVNIGIQDCQKDINDLKNFIENADIIILNALEFATLVKKTPETLDVTKDVGQLAHLRPEQILVVTDGKNGSHGYTNGEIFFQEAKPGTKMVDVNGAGDAYTAGFITSFLKTLDIRQAMVQGADYAAAIISRIGAN